MDLFKTFSKRTSLLALCSASLVLAGAATAPAQAAGYTKVNSGVFAGRTYEVWRSDMGTLTWSDAQAYATSTLGGSLVSINNTAEDTFVAGLIQNASLYTDSNAPANNFVGPYIGLRRQGNAGATVGWQWLDGTPLTTSDPLWANWYAAAGQPDAMNDDNVALYYNGSNGTLFPPGGSAGFPTTWGDVYDGANLVTGPGSPGPNPYLANSFVIEKVPGPLPVMGAFAAFRLSRRLRRRTCVGVRNA